MKTLLNLLLRTQGHPRRHPPKSTGGFTMIELMVGMIIAFLIIVPMLAFVVDILNRDVREQVKSNTEQDLQAAVDYMTQDMSQALYVYDLNKDGKTAEEQTKIDNFIAELPQANDDTQTPILVFWKRDFVENAIDGTTGGICEDPDNDPCDDTFVMSLVAYYLIEDGKDTWCQPLGGTCPKRIARFQIQDGARGNNGYVCDQDADGDGRSSDCESNTDLKNFQRDKGFNDFNTSDPLAWTKYAGEDYDNPLNVLVNYIQVFDLERVSDSNKLATIKLVGNALRRTESGATCDNSSGVYEPKTYCPTMTVNLGGRSGFGSSE